MSSGNVCCQLCRGKRREEGGGNMFGWGTPEKILNFQVIADSVLQRTRRLLASKGIPDFEKTHLQVCSVLS